MVRVQTKPEPSQQRPRRPIRDLMPSRQQRASEPRQAIRGPPQRRLSIATRIRIHQRLTRPHQLRISLRLPRTPYTSATNPPRIEPRALPHLRDAKKTW